MTYLSDDLYAKNQEKEYIIKFFENKTEVIPNSRIDYRHFTRRMLHG